MSIRESDIAIIGLSCRFPGANNIDEFWQNLLAGVESISVFENEELERADPQLFDRPNYVKAGAVLPDIDKFDAAFFGYSAREAEMIDPQQRIFLESAWTAFESAGYNPETYPGLVGVYAGSGMNGYFINNVHPSCGFSPHRTFLESALDLQVRLTNGKDYLPTRVSYKLNLGGPSLNVQTACSTALVAVHLACQSLLNGECDMTLAGGVTVSVPHKTGYLYQEDMIGSPDGKCRAFDADAKGTVFGNGVGVVLLKLLSQAMEDGDKIHAVIKGSAVNNDGALKVGYTAPSVEGQAAVISEALAVADIEAGSIGYVEAHGTGTTLGDPIEIAALTQAYRNSTDENGYCAIGSVKTNIGHLLEAAGMAGLIKTVLALENQQIPPTLNFHRPNPNIDFAQSPFYVNTTLSHWKTDDQTPRRAGVSSFGMGGTNAHVILEEAPVEHKREEGEERPVHLLTLSAKTEKALRELVGRYLNYLDSEPEAKLADICFTANTGRKHFNHRLAVVAESKQQLRDSLAQIASNSANGAAPSSLREVKSVPRTVAFLFTGQGSQSVGMGRQLYETQPKFRETIDLCDEILRPFLDVPLVEVLYPQNAEETSHLLNQTAYTQPALFSLEYALFQLWKSWGIEPHIVMGHSVGEYVAAVVAGVFSLEDGLKLIAERGRLMQALPPDGAMVSLLATEKQVKAAISPYETDVSIAAINGPESIVISGKQEAIEAVCAILEPQGIKTKKLTVSHAFHSPLMEPMLAEFDRVARQIDYSPPALKLMSNVTGLVATDEVATPDYWCRHIRQAVRFAPSMKGLVRQKVEVFLEVGPKPILLGMGRQCLPQSEGLWLPSLRPPQEDWQQLLSSLAELYVQGIPVDWQGFDGDYSRVRENLPTYPFQRQRYWLEAPQWYRSGKFDRSYDTNPKNQNGKSTQIERSQTAEKSLENCLYEVEWQLQSRQKAGALSPKHWLILADRQGVGEALAQRLQSEGCHTTVVVWGEEYQRQNDSPQVTLRDRHFTLNPDRPQQFEQLLQAVPTIEGIVHLWSLDVPPTQTAADLEDATKLSLCSTLYLLQSLIKEYTELPRLWLITRGAQPVVASEKMPGVGQSPLWGMGKSIALEHPELQCSLVDLDPDTKQAEAETLFAEIGSNNTENQVAFRGKKRYVSRLVSRSYQQKAPLALDDNSTYIITGGLGGLGLSVARTLAERGAKYLVLVGRSEPQPEVKDRLKEIEAAGVQVTIALADVAETEELALVLAKIDRTLPPLRGIVHAAGVVDFCGLWQQDWTRFAGVLAAKVQGTWNLHALTKDRPLDFFVGFSSLASLLGSHGLASYGAANGFVDAIVHHRRALGLPGLSINWGAWADVGMGARLGKEHQQRLSAWGLNTIDPQRGLAVLEQLLQQDIPQVGVLPMDWSKWLGQFSSIPPFYQQVAPSKVHGQKTIDLGQQFKTIPANQRRSRLVSHVRTLVATTLGLKEVEQIGLDTQFVDLGLDSLMAMELRSHLQSSLGCSLGSTVLFKYPTLAELVDYLDREVLGLENSNNRNGNDRYRSTVVPIQPQGSQPPLFFVTGILGGVFDLYPLAKSLGGDRPFYGLRSLGMDENEQPLTRMEDIAAHHIKSIQQIQPIGPYFLGGHSFGGKVAFEMAQQLRSIGHEVSLLAIMDIQVAIPQSEKDVAAWDDARAISHLASIYGSALGKKIEIEVEALRSLEPQEQLQHLRLMLKMAGQHSSETELQQLLQVYRANTRANTEYIAREIYPTPITFFRARDIGVLGDYLPDRSTTEIDPTWGWSQLSTLPVKLQLIPGNHFTMMAAPQVEILAEQLQCFLEPLKLTVGSKK
ncbi:MAG: SDR family NAD(P)-dependent oxidoreductase [Geitlerinemataceae cyanobacterium]